MMMKQTLLLPAIFLALSSVANAGGSIIHNGGSSIVCFSIPATEAMFNGLITKRGTENIQSAHVLEYYLAAQKRNQASPFFQEIKANHPEKALAYLNSLIAMVPRFERDLALVADRIGYVGNGIGVSTALQRVDDSDLLVGLPENCAQVQTVIRRDGVLFFDTTIWNALGKQDAIQQSIMQLHEEIYTLDSPNISSVKTQTLLIYLLGDEVTKRTLITKIANSLNAYNSNPYKSLVDPTDQRMVRFALIDLFQSAINAEPKPAKLQSLLNSLDELRKNAPIDPSLWSEKGAVDNFELCLRDMLGIAAIHFNSDAYEADRNRIQAELDNLRREPGPF